MSTKLKMAVLVVLALAVLAAVLSGTFKHLGGATPAAKSLNPNSPPPGVLTSGGEVTDVMPQAKAAYAACTPPVEPSVVLNGERATREEMVAVRELIKTFDRATASYTACLDQASDRLVTELKDKASEAQLHAVGELGINMHNAAVTRDEGVAESFNKQLRLFKAKHASQPGHVPVASKP